MAKKVGILEKLALQVKLTGNDSAVTVATAAVFVFSTNGQDSATSQLK
jgi:hypothetical protein